MFGPILKQVLSSLAHRLKGHLGSIIHKDQSYWMFYAGHLHLEDMQDLAGLSHIKFGFLGLDQEKASDGGSWIPFLKHCMLLAVGSCLWQE